MYKIISIKLTNNEIYMVGDLLYEKIEKVHDDDGKLWFAVSGKGEYIDVNGDCVITVRYTQC